MTTSANNGRRRWLLSCGAVAIAWLATVIGLVWSASAERATVRTQMQARETCIEDHEARLRLIEHDLTQLVSDVSWIRSTIERNGKGADGK